MQVSRFALPFFLLAAAAPTCAAPRASVPPLSFLSYHAGSVRALTQEVSLDPAVRRRLANHFGVTEAQMTRYVRRSLVLTRLKTGGSYRVACVRPDGREFWVDSHLPAGTPIFASRATGLPVLKLAYGNPMVSTLPQSQAAAGGADPAAPPQLATLAESALASVAPQLAPSESSFVTATSLSADAGLATPAAVEVADYTGGLTSLASASHANSLVPALLGLLGAGGAVAAASHHGGGSSAPAPAPFQAPTPVSGPVPSISAPVSEPSPSVPSAPVPESSTLASLGALLLLGGGSLAAARRRCGLGRP